MFLEKENAPENRFFYGSSRYSYLKGGKSDIFYNNKNYIVNIKSKKSKDLKIPTSFQSKLLGMYDPDKIRELEKSSGVLKRVSSKGYLFKSRDKPFKEEAFKKSAFIGATPHKINNLSVNLSKSLNCVSDQTDINNNASKTSINYNHNKNQTGNFKKSHSSISIINPNKALYQAKLDNNFDNQNNFNSKILIKSQSQSKIVNKAAEENSFYKLNLDKSISNQFQIKENQIPNFKIKQYEQRDQCFIEDNKHKEKSLGYKKGINTYKKNESSNIFLYNTKKSILKKKNNNVRVYSMNDLNQFINT